LSTPASAPIRLWLAPWPDATRGWHWLRATLADALGCAADDLHIVRDVRGKPQLSATQAHWHFSLSHSGALALLALADLPVGVDLEAPRPQLRALALAARYFAADESAALQQLSHGRQALAFRQLWTAKEAVLKADGSGLAYGLERVVHQNSNFSLSQLHSVSRTYGGNTLKVEPRELDNLPVVNPLALSDNVRQEIKRWIADFYRHRQTSVLMHQVNGLVERLLSGSADTQPSRLPIQLRLLETGKQYDVSDGSPEEEPSRRLCRERQ